MIFKRFAANLRAQNWSAIGIEFAIVVAGVFVGNWVNDWSQARAEKRETQRMLTQLTPTLKTLTDFYKGAHVYYRTTRHYAGTAIAGWRHDPNVSDADFVIAAYQASQIFGFGTNGSLYSTVLGADRLRDITDPAIRDDLNFLMTADYTQFDTNAVNTPYRQNVRRVIPIEIAEAIRKECGDRVSPETVNYLILPPQCPIVIPAKQAAAAASLLRARPDLLLDLQWHLAAQASLLENMSTFETVTTDLEKRVSALRR